MILLVDVGNTNIVIGVYKDNDYIEEYDDIDEDDLSIWTRVKEKFTLRLKKR